MFQGSRNVPPESTSRRSWTRAARLNATTWFDRTNYFETIPKGALELALWLEADRHGHLLDAVTQENLDNQRDVVKEEKRQRYDNVPYGTALIDIYATRLPRGPPLPPPDDRLDGGPRCGDARGRPRLLPGSLRAQQHRADPRRRHHARGGLRGGREVLRPAAGASSCRAGRGCRSSADRRPGARRPRRRRAQRPPLRRLPPARRHDAGLPRLSRSPSTCWVGWPAAGSCAGSCAPTRPRWRSAAGRWVSSTAWGSEPSPSTSSAGADADEASSRPLRGDRALHRRRARRGASSSRSSPTPSARGSAPWPASRSAPTTSATTPC